MTAVFITVYRQRTQPKINEERSVQGQINQIILPVSIIKQTLLHVSMIKQTRLHASLPCLYERDLSSFSNMSKSLLCNR